MPEKQIVTKMNKNEHFYLNICIDKNSSLKIGSEKDIKRFLVGTFLCEKVINFDR